MSDTVIHIVGVDIEVGPYLRQRCSWCGALLLDYDLSLTAMVIPAGKTEDQARDDGDLKPATWPIGDLLAVDGSLQYTVPHVDGARLPETCCAMLDPSVTR